MHVNDYGTESWTILNVVIFKHSLFCFFFFIFLFFVCLFVCLFACYFFWLCIPRRSCLIYLSLFKFLLVEWSSVSWKTNLTTFPYLNKRQYKWFTLSSIAIVILTWILSFSNFGSPSNLFANSTDILLRVYFYEYNKGFSSVFYYYSTLTLWWNISK